MKHFLLKIFLSVLLLGNIGTHSPAYALKSALSQAVSIVTAPVRIPYEVAFNTKHLVKQICTHGPCPYRQNLGVTGTSGYLRKYQEGQLKKYHRNEGFYVFKKKLTGKTLILKVSDDLTQDPLINEYMNFQTAIQEFAQQNSWGNVVVIQSKQHAAKPRKSPFENTHLHTAVSNLSERLDIPVYCITDCYWGDKAALDFILFSEAQPFAIGTTDNLKSLKNLPHRLEINDRVVDQNTPAIEAHPSFQSYQAEAQTRASQSYPTSINMNASRLSGFSQLKMFQNGKAMPFQGELPLPLTLEPKQAALVLDIDESLTLPRGLDWVDYEDFSNANIALYSRKVSDDDLFEMQNFYRDEILSLLDKGRFPFVLLNSATHPVRAHHIAKSLSLRFPELTICASGGCYGEAKAAINAAVLAPDVPRVVIGNSVAGDKAMLRHIEGETPQLSIAIQNPGEDSWKEQKGLKVILSEQLGTQLSEVVSNFLDKL